MNRTQLVEAVANETDLTNAQAQKAVTAMLDAITNSVAADEKVTIPGFGTFELRRRSARSGRNPQTGESMEIPASAAPAFKAGAKFKQAVADA